MFNDSSRSIDNLIREGYSVDAGRYIGKGWEIFKRNAGGFVGFTLICFLIAVVLASISPQPNSNAGIGTNTDAADSLRATLGAIGNLIFSIISGPLYAGFTIVAFKLIKQQATQFSDFFRGLSGNYFLQIFLANLLIGIFVAIGTLLLILPGIYLAVAYMLAVPLIVERKLGFWDAMEASRKIVTKRWFAFFGFGLLLLVINFAGALLCGLGLLVTVPLTYCAIVAAYENIIGLNLSSEM